MNRTLTLTIGSALVVVTAILLMNKAVGQGDAGQKTGQPSGPGMMKGGMGMEKMPEPMKLRCRMMMNMEVTSHDPAALLALKDQLKLSEEQVNRLQAIVAQARQQAEQVLTDQQKSQLQPLEKTPETMMDMHQQMMEKMGQANRGRAGRMSCPMMEMMQHADQQQPAAKSSAAEHGHEQ